MCKISDKSNKFLLNYSNLLRCPLFPDTVYIQRITLRCYFNSKLHRAIAASIESTFRAVMVCNVMQLSDSQLYAYQLTTFL